MPSTPRQLLEQATRHAAHLERLKTQEARELLSLFSDIEAQIMGRLSGQDVTQWSRARMTRQIAAIRAAMNQGMDETIIPALNASIRDLAKYEAEFETRSLAEIGLRYDFDLPSSGQVMSAVRTQPMSVKGADEGKLLSAFVRDWSETQVTRTANTIRSGYAQGLTTQQVVSQIRTEAGPIGRRGLEAMARTSLQHAANQARQATWAANSDIVRRVRIVATLDSRTSTICMSLDGREYPLDEGPRPPFHVNCRTTTAAALDDRFAVLDEGGTRRSRDPETGSVGDAPANETYYGWLKRQPAEVQDSIIGPARGKLMRDGGLTSERFAELQLGKRFEPLTLEKMKELEPVAFKRAGLE